MVRIGSQIIYFHSLLWGPRYITVVAINLNAYLIQGFTFLEEWREMGNTNISLVSGMLHVVPVSVLSIFSYFLDFTVQLE